MYKIQWVHHITVSNTAIYCVKQNTVSYWLLIYTRSPLSTCCGRIMLYSFGHCIVCPLIYGFRLPLLYLQTFFYYIFKQHSQFNTKVNNTRVGLGFMVFNTTFNNISVISWCSILLVEEIGENHQPVANHSQT